MKKFRDISEQYREEGRHKLIQPKNKEVVSPRPKSDSANVKLKETVKDKFDIGEYDQEGDMAKSDLRSILANAKRVHDMLEDSDNLPEWVQSKITKAEDYMSTVANYMEAEMNEEVELDEENKPTNPELWARAKAMAKSKFDVYPSAYANGWAAKWYKSKGGGWRSVNEAKDDLPFKADKPTKQIAKPGKFGVGYSTAKHLAKMAMQKQMQKMKKPVKEETMSKKAKIVKDAMKKPSKDDQFQAEPMISQSIVKNN